MNKKEQRKLLFFYLLLFCIYLCNEVSNFKFYFFVHIDSFKRTKEPAKKIRCCVLACIVLCIFFWLFRVHCNLANGQNISNNLTNFYLLPNIKAEQKIGIEQACKYADEYGVKFTIAVVKQG